jgi:hypothetical protein
MAGGYTETGWKMLLALPGEGKVNTIEIIIKSGKLEYTENLQSDLEVFT